MIELRKNQQQLVQQFQAFLKSPEVAQLRYIPLAALYDGNQWLVQRFGINNITALSLTDFNTKPQAKLQVLAGAFTTGSYNVQNQCHPVHIILLFICIVNFVTKTLIRCCSG
ncbi:hypothetical protein [Allocoleopsis franciscana]|uniref:hypothetical protein n=1 Tax=Allocoleopsis franciscana TaxID=2886352 RepID=UPI00030447F0|nr:hypothetical protein [Allocoleopsis franciscana]